MSLSWLALLRKTDFDTIVSINLGRSNIRNRVTIRILKPAAKGNELLILPEFFNRIRNLLSRSRNQIKAGTSRGKDALSGLLLAKPSRKVLVLVLIALCLLLIALLYLAGFFGKSATKIKNRPTFLLEITEGKHSLSAPLGVATWGDRVYIADSGNGQVVVTDLEGHYKFSFKVRAGKNKDSYPVGIDVSDSGNVYVSDLYQPMIKVFDLDGKYSEDFPDSSYVLKKPLAVAYVDSKIYITDIGDQTVKVFDPSGTLERKFGWPGQRKGQLAYPNGIAVDEAGNMFVADSNNSRVQVFNARGKLLRVFEGELSLPKGIAIDKFQRVHVADALARKIFVFDKQGKLLFSYGEAELGGDLAVPTGIAINEKASRVFITDRGKDCVSVWGY